jgi:putative transposase
LLNKSAACAWFDITRQAYYQARKRELVREAEEQFIVELTQGIRQRHPRMGTRKIYDKLRSPMASLGIRRGRDAFFDTLRAHNLLVMPKRNHRRTTHAGFLRYQNLISTLEITHPNQVWVGDITYITTEEGFVYLALLTDIFSRFIVGYDLSSSLAVEGAQRALEIATKNALKMAPREKLEGLIHHSDHGVQYTARAYQEELKRHAMKASMGEVGNCYDNAIAERVNGILKNEYNLDALFPDLQQACRSVKESIKLYNFDRPHLSLNMATPASFYILN